MSPRKSEPPARRCPICGKPRSEKLKPFCSKKCADIDLARWLAGNYVIPEKSSEDADSAPESGTEGET